MATVTKRESKSGVLTYRIKVVAGYDEFHKQVQKTVTWKNENNLPEEEAFAAATQFSIEYEAQVKKDFEAGVSQEEEKKKGNISFNEFVSSYWIPFYVEDGTKKATTVANYKQQIKPALEFFGKAFLTTISPLMVDKFLKWLRTDYRTQYGKVSTEKSTKHYYVAFNNVLKYAKKLKYIAEIPTVDTKTPTVHKKKIVSMTKEETKKFLDALNESDLEFKTQMYILLTSGLRRGELLGLKWEDIDFMKGTVNIERNIVTVTGSTKLVTTPKTENSVREAPLTNQSLKLLAMLRTQSKNEWVFESRTPNSLTTKVKRFMKRNELPDYSPHDLRHTCASLLNANKVDLKTIQLVLGHSDASTTLNYYIGVETSQLTAAVNELERALA